MNEYTKESADCIDLMIKFNAMSYAERAALMASREEIPRLRECISQIAQVRHVSGSAQSAFLTTLRMCDATLAGADLRSVEVVEAVAAGTWKATEEAPYALRMVPGAPYPLQIIRVADGVVMDRYYETSRGSATDRLNQRNEGL